MEKELTILMPCLDEAETVPSCVEEATRYLADREIVGEVVVADNGSADGSQKLAASGGARVVTICERGYGAALRGGIAESRGRFIIMGDADGSYDFSSIDPFVEALRGGADLVMGNRFRGGIEPGAMPPLHRYLGNPVLSFLGRLFFGSPIGDFHCGLRGFRRDSVLRLDLQSTGMEFASEMVVKATLRGQDIVEVPTRLHPDGRSRPPHLRSWRDGWRHLRFLLLCSPRWLFLNPGLALMAAGLLGGLLVSITSVRVGPATLDVNTLVVCAAMAVVGYQAVWFAVLSKTVAIREGLLPADARIERLSRRLPLERVLLAGALSLLVGLALLVFATVDWNFSPLDPRNSLRLTVPAVLLGMLGMQTIFSGMLKAVMEIRTAPQAPAVLPMSVGDGGHRPTAPAGSQDPELDDVGG